MWRFAKAFVTATLSFAMAFSTAVPADADQGCRYWILVTRAGVPGEETALECDATELVDWLRVAPEVEVSAQPPQAALYDSFTVTVGLRTGTESLEGPPSQQRDRIVLLTERVYPVAEGGPVAFVPSTSTFHGPGQASRWVVQAGWRSLDATKPVPKVLTTLGMLQPTTEGPTTSPLTPTTAAPTTSAGSPGPDLVTLLFLLAILFLGAGLRRSMRRARQNVPDGASDRSGVSPHG